MSRESTAQPVSTMNLPLMPLRDMVVFPHMVLPLFVGRPKSIQALKTAMQGDRHIVLVAQKTAATDEPQAEDMFKVGCVSTIMQMLELPDGTVKVLIEGVERTRIETIHDEETLFTATAMPMPLQEEASHPHSEIEALRRAVMQQFDNYVKLNRKIPQEILQSIAAIHDVGRMADTIAAHMPIKMESKQLVLELVDIKLRLESLLEHLENEVEILNVDKRIRSRVKRQVEKNNRNVYLNEQVKAIQKELGNGEDGADIEELEKRIKTARMPAEALKKAEGEVKKLKLSSPMSPDASVMRNYLDVLCDIPWSKKTKISRDLARAEAILDEDHYGLEKVKERIIEYLAVQQRVDKVKSPILCLLGPPGVGKTSLGQSIAKATGRKYVRMALGGVRDEAEIRGHRRTYIGSMPGKIVQNLIKVGARNPLFLLDEIDKIGTDFRGDPASALLEVLDPEQNHKFSDHYVEVDLDLSDVMFVATSNSYNIPPALLDRMEVIRLSGYTEDEKTSIAMKYLCPKQMTNNGLKDNELEITEDAVRAIVRYYTSEAGVRSLERELSKICRKVVKGLQLKTVQPGLKVTADDLANYLGVRKYDYGRAQQENKVGQVAGLAWTEVGGDLLTVEVAVMPGKGHFTCTGSLGEVMKESVEAARTVVRSRARVLGIQDDLFEKRDLHIHVPDGATPKDGPSAGIAMTTAIVSALTGIAVRADVAMTGEITLRGEVTAIGGLKEKLLAALRGGIKTVLIPEENIKDLQEIPDNVKSSMEIIPVKWIDKVLDVALERKPVALSEEELASPPAVEAATVLESGTTPTAVKH